MSTEDQLRLLWIKGIQQVSGKRAVSTELFFKSNNTTAERIVEQEKFSLYVANPKKSSEYLAHEADRFSSAAFETLSCETARPETPHAVAWSLIRSYYAAFFSLHALIRLHGWSCTNVTKEIAVQINNEAKLLYPSSLKISAGLYLIQFASAGSDITATRLDSGSGGSHEQLWSILEKYLFALTKASLLVENENYGSSDFSHSIERLRQRIKKYGGHSWFTRTRNRLNYAHGFGAWFPYTNSQAYREIHVSTTKWLDQPTHCLSSAQRDELVEFSEACSFIVSMCRTTVLDLVRRSAVKSTFQYSSQPLILQATNILQSKPASKHHI
jgi:hypothetical protein